MNTFNRCEKEGCLMETLDIWSRAHPALKTLPMEWDYSMPFGIIYSRNPSALLKDFLKVFEDQLQ